VTEWKVCLTFDVDLVDHCSGTPTAEMTEAVPVLLDWCDRHDVVATWCLRLDRHIAATIGSETAVFERYGAVIDAARARGHEIAWHPHAYTRDRSGAWVQNTDGAAVADELESLAPIARALALQTVRTGWGFHTSDTMRVLASAGFTVDSSAIPRPRYPWELSAKDWTRAPEHPYRPSVADYQLPGEPSLPIVEVPISVEVIAAPRDTQQVKRYLNPAFHAPLLQPALRRWTARHRHVVMVTHPYEVRPAAASHDLIAFDLDVFDRNVRYLRELADAAGARLTFTTLSSLAVAA